MREGTEKGWEGVGQGMGGGVREEDPGEEQSGRKLGLH